MTLILH